MPKSVLDYRSHKISYLSVTAQILTCDLWLFSDSWICVLPQRQSIPPDNTQKWCPTWPFPTNQGCPSWGNTRPGKNISPRAKAKKPQRQSSSALRRREIYLIYSLNTFTYMYSFICIIITNKCINLSYIYIYIYIYIKSNHFYCHITTAQVPWWVKFLRENNNLHMDSTYLQTVQKTMCKIHIHILSTHSVYILFNCVRNFSW